MEGGVRFCSSHPDARRGRILAVGESEALAGKAGADCRRRISAARRSCPATVTGTTILFSLQTASALFHGRLHCLSQIRKRLAQRLCPGNPPQDWMSASATSQPPWMKGSSGPFHAGQVIPSVRPILISHASRPHGLRQLRSAFPPPGSGPGTPDRWRANRPPSRRYAQRVSRKRFMALAGTSFRRPPGTDAAPSG